MSKNSVFRQRTTTCRQISAVRAVRIAFLLSLFASIVGHDLSRLKPSVLSLFRRSGAIICFNGWRLKRDKSCPTVDTLVFRARQNVINRTPPAGACRLILCYSYPEQEYYKRNRLSFIRQIISAIQLLKNVNKINISLRKLANIFSLIYLWRCNIKMISH